MLESYYENPRELLLFFYYPSDEYISYLMTVDELIIFPMKSIAKICFRGKIKESGLWCLRLDNYSVICSFDTVSIRTANMAIDISKNRNGGFMLASLSLILL